MNAPMIGLLISVAGAAMLIGAAMGYYAAQDERRRK